MVKSQDQQGLSLHQRELFSSLTQYAFNAVLVFVFVFPIVFMVMSSFKQNVQIFRDLRSIQAFLPTGQLSFDNYRSVFEHSQLLRFVGNSIGIGALQVILALTVNSMAAYALSRLVWQGQQIVLAVIIATLIVPFETIAMPLLLLVSKLPSISFQQGFHLSAGWLNTYQVQIIPFVAGAYSIFLFYQFFKDIPRELDESALIDGASRFQIYRHIIVPNSGPVFATVAILSFLGSWNSFLWPIIVVQSEELRPVMVGLQYFFQRVINWGEVMAYTTMVTLPVLGLFLAFQGAFVKSLASSAVKGLKCCEGIGRAMHSPGSDPPNPLEASIPDLYRPLFHFTPPRHWMNDPNGLVYFEGEYHLFYQHNPSTNDWGNMSWGHAISRDLLHWEHLPVAIPFDGTIMAFSGSAVVDWENSSGFGIDARPPLVLIFTGHHAQQQHEGQWLEDQRLAYSNDRGRMWTIFDGNPVLDLGSGDFRDPKVFWHAPGQRWIMLVVLAAQYRVRIYASGDLKTWTHQSDFGPAGSTGGVWEMPEMFELPIENSGETRWVLKVDLGDGGPHGGSAGQYFIGQFDGERFIPDSLETAPNWLDYGKDFYAALSWSDIPATDGRRLWIAWMSNWQYARETPTFSWRNAMTIPRNLSLERIEGAVRLVQRPIRELEQLRHEPYHLADTVLNEDSLPLPVRGTSLEIIAEFTPGTATEFGLNVRVGPKAHTLVGYDAANRELFVDRRTSGEVGFDARFAGRHGGPLMLEDGRLRLHVFIDRSSVEVFGNDGQTIITDLIFPAPDDDGLELYALGGTVRLTALSIWELRPGATTASATGQSDR